jgi:hypothetical protein
MRTLPSNFFDAVVDVTVFERHRYAAMETSFANGGQLSARKTEVWNIGSHG